MASPAEHLVADKAVRNINAAAAQLQRVRIALDKAREYAEVTPDGMLPPDTFAALGTVLSEVLALNQRVNALAHAVKQPAQEVPDARTT